jgi:hypothetical protein
MNTCIVKRLANELKIDLTPNYDKISVIYETNSTSVAINNVTFVLSNSYPFSSPSIFIDTFSNALGSAATYPPNNISYYQYMISSSPRINRITRTLNNNTCMCCTTISCKNNWMPSQTLKKLMLEIEKMKLIKQKTKYIMMTEIICKDFSHRIHDNVNADIEHVILRFLY